MSVNRHVVIAGFAPEAIATASRLLGEASGPVVHLVGDLGVSQDDVLHDLLATAPARRLVIHNQRLSRPSALS